MMTDDELITNIEYLRNTMISVSTGGHRIQDVDVQYQATYSRVALELKRRKIENPIGFQGLWDWYGHWSSGDLPSYASRRSFIGKLINPLIDRIQNDIVEVIPPTGWPRVDRTIAQLQGDILTASVEEQFQTIGMLCRETLISLAQAVYDLRKYPPLDGISPSETDAKRMLEAYIAIELKGGANDETRKYARASLDLANNLQHHRTATFRDAALCLEATKSVVNVIAILDGRRGK